MLGRLHSAEEAMQAVAIARAAFDRYSFDLIYARPDQTPQMWTNELTRAIGEAAEHLSLYQLTFEEGTPFFGLHAAGKLKTPNEDLARTLYEVTQEVCAKRGLSAYEISNHARPRPEANGHGAMTDDELNSEQRADEFLLMGLRLAEGIDPGRYAAISGRALNPARIALLREEGAIVVDADGRLRVTQEGFPVLDAVGAGRAAGPPGGE